MKRPLGRALANPKQYVDYALGFAGDPVDDASATAHHLTQSSPWKFPPNPEPPSTAPLEFLYSIGSVIRAKPVASRKRSGYVGRDLLS